MAKFSYEHGSTSVTLRVKILDSSKTDGSGLTGLAFGAGGLIISTIADVEAAKTVYTQAASTIEDITTLGTYAAPTATKCRFKEVDATNHPGVYEIHLADARFAVADANSLQVAVHGAVNAAQTDAEIQLRPAPANVKEVNESTAAATGLANVGTNADGSGRIAGIIGTINTFDGLGTLASQADVQAIQNNTRTTASLSGVMERPDAGTTRFKVYLNNYDTTGNMEAPDSAPTVAVVNEAGTSRSGNLQHPGTSVPQTTMVLLSAGRYWIEYELDNADPSPEQLIFTFTIIEGGVTRTVDRATQVADTTGKFTSADRTKLDTLHDTRLTAARAANLDAITAARLAELDAANIPSDIDTLLARLSSARALLLDNLDAAITSRPTVAEIWTRVVEASTGAAVKTNNFTAEEVMRLMLGVLAGRTTSSGLTFLTPDNSQQRVVTTVTGTERTAVVLKV